MDINQIGLLLAYQRTKRDISVGELCEGICSRGFIGHVENGERSCEKIVAEALLQRAGFASDQMLYFLEKEEADWLMIKEQLLAAVAALKLEEIERLIQEYKRITVEKSVLHEQFLILIQSVLRWKLYLNKEEKYEKILDYAETDSFICKNEKRLVHKGSRRYVTEAGYETSRDYYTCEDCRGCPSLRFKNHSFGTSSISKDFF